MTPRHRADPYWMLVPTALLLCVFFFYPLAYAAYRSLFEWDLLTPPRYVGFAQYRFLLASGELAQALGTTMLFSIIVVTGSVALGLALALALNRSGALAAFVRSAIFSAYVVSWVSVALLFLWILDSQAGAFTALVRSIGIKPANWLGDPDVALYTVSTVTVWKLAGYSMILFLTGLQDVPRDLLEAAALDGAGRWNRFLHVTWPLLRPTLAFVVTTSLILTFQVFDVVRIMTQGGPVRATTLFVYAIYEQAFMNLRVGRANAEIMVFFCVLLVLTALELLAFRRKAAT